MVWLTKENVTSIQRLKMCTIEVAMKHITELKLLLASKNIYDLNNDPWERGQRHLVGRDGAVLQLLSEEGLRPQRHMCHRNLGYIRCCREQAAVHIRRCHWWRHALVCHAYDLPRRALHVRHGRTVSAGSSLCNDFGHSEGRAVRWVPHSSSS